MNVGLEKEFFLVDEESKVQVIVGPTFHSFVDFDKVIKVVRAIVEKDEQKVQTYLSEC